MQSFADHSGAVLSTDLQMTDSHRLPLGKTVDASTRRKSLHLTPDLGARLLLPGAYLSTGYLATGSERRTSVPREGLSACNTTVLSGTNNRTLIVIGMNTNHKQDLQDGMNTGASPMEMSMMKFEHVAREDLTKEPTTVDADGSLLDTPIFKKSSPPPIPPRSSRRLSRKFTPRIPGGNTHKLDDASESGFAVPMNVDDYMVTTGPQTFPYTLQGMSVTSLTMSSDEESTYDEKKLHEFGDGSLYEEYKDEIDYKEDEFNKESDGTTILEETCAPLLEKPSKKSGPKFTLAGTKRSLEQKFNGAKRIFSSKKQNNAEVVEKAATTCKDPCTPSMRFHSIL